MRSAPAMSVVEMTSGCDAGAAEVYLIPAGEAEDRTRATMQQNTAIAIRIRTTKSAKPHWDNNSKAAADREWGVVVGLSFELHHQAA